MAKQNIYDNEIFFEGYKKIRDNEANANNLFEKGARSGVRFWRTLYAVHPARSGKGSRH